MRRARWFVAIAVVVGCGPGARPAPPVKEPVAEAPAGVQPQKPEVAPAPAPEPAPGPPEVKNIDSKDILARAEGPSPVFVKHVLVGWRELSSDYRGRLDPRAAARNRAEAAAIAKQVAGKLQADPAAIGELAKELSEDPGSLGGDPYVVKADSPFVPEFKNLALRLHENEVGIVQTRYGYHVVLRVPPPPPDPLESADILVRPPNPGPVHILHILIAWMDVPTARDPRALERSKADADKLAQQVLAKARARGDMAKLMKQYSEDPGSKDTARPYEVGADTSMAMFEPFKNMALRLKLNEVGLVKSQLGWHIMKRVPPPPPDPLTSTAILQRAPQTASAKVKNILLGWTEAHAEDERGKDRDRATLEKLVRATLARLKKGEKIESLMAELSEDPGSAESGESYPVTPDAALVAPFKDLSLRLKVGEVGVVKTEYGIHIIQRVE
ncbi:MAG TPA: peptidylprolyl isomerase [Kofleriaceae bacterium]